MINLPIKILINDPLFGSAKKVFILCDTNDHVFTYANVKCFYTKAFYQLNHSKMSHQILYYYQFEVLRMLTSLLNPKAQLKRIKF